MFCDLVTNSCYFVFIYSVIFSLIIFVLAVFLLGGGIAETEDHS